LQCWEEENQGGEEEEDEDEELVNPDVMDMDEADWQVWARLCPNNTIPLYNASDVGRRPIDDGWDIDAAHGRWNNINLLSSWIDEQKCEAHQPEDDTPQIDVGTLEAEQRTIFNDYITAVTAAYATIMYRLEVIMTRLSAAAFWLRVWEIDDIVRARRTGDST
jgi:hypothetical protein